MDIEVSCKRLKLPGREAEESSSSNNKIRNEWFYTSTPHKCLHDMYRDIFYIIFFFIYVHGSVHRESNLITVQQDATYSVCYISVGSSTCFGC